MEQRKAEADATDLSRLAWLYLHLHDSRRASEIVEEGLVIDPENEYCNRLARRLGRSAGLAEDGGGWVISQSLIPFERAR